MADIDLAAQIKTALAEVEIPGGGDLATYGGLSEIIVTPGAIAFAIAVAPGMEAAFGPARDEAHKAAQALGGSRKVMVSLTAEKSNTPKFGHGGAQPQGKTRVNGVKRIIAVGSGKGGVGKSTTAVNIALGLQSLGLRVGILDADIYGPSVPRLMNISGRPQQLDGKLIKPMENYGLRTMSMGYLVDEGTAMIWRGPMIQSALLQMLREVAWGDLDVLVVDMPPGTGDAQLTMAQQVPLSGAVIVSTPQDLALIDARKGIAMFQKVEVPLLGVVENMSHFICPTCGTNHDIFGHGGARAEAEKLGVAFLGEVPLAMTIRENSDSGTPVTVSAPDGPHARVYRDIAGKVWNQLSGEGAVARTAPAIVFE
jgi:ATP-binding protein involved in chromosome partitioning